MTTIFSPRTAFALWLATALIPVRQVHAAPEVTISPSSGGGDTARIQQAIDNSSGEVHFEAGVYKLNGPIHLGGKRPDGQLRGGNRTFRGAGSWHPRYGSILLQQTPNAPIFDVEGLIGSVTITGLTFDGVTGANAKGIAAADSTGVLATSTIRGNYFLVGLAEGIDIALQSTRIEGNQFGINGAFGSLGSVHRHIHSISSDQNIETNANWIVGNYFRTARGSESVLFEQGGKLHVIGNWFESNGADTTLRINGMFQVVIEGNYFEANTGDAQMTFGNALNGLGNYVLRLENNYYHMGGQNGVPNHFVFTVERSGPHRSFPGQTQVFMGYETGTFFAPTAELTPADVFQACYLTITSPGRAFRLNGYTGTQTGGNASCH